MQQGARLLLACGVMGLAAGAASAAEAELAGVFGAKAVLVVDGGPPRTLAVGQRTPEGVKLLEVRASDSSAMIELDGRPQRIAMGQAPVRSAAEAGAAGTSMVADSQGHHFANGSINGAPVRFLVDTGASMVSIGASDARRAGIDYRRGTVGRVQTASGPATVWQVRLDTVRVGEIGVNGVDALVHENDLPYVLLGMTFLNRMDMQRMGDRLVLRKRY